MKLFMLIAALLVTTTFVRAKVLSEIRVYTDGKTSMDGLFLWDDSKEGRRPGVLIFHAWKGPGSFEIKQAERLARLGYVAFVADIYGTGVRPKSNKEAAKRSGHFKNNPPKLRRRARLALEQIKTHKLVDGDRVGAIGYCFGGTTVLELARSGADVKGVVSFHGGLKTSLPAKKGNIKSKILVLHGTVDPHAPMADVNRLISELEAVDVDYYIELYGGAVHAFTNPGAGTDVSIGVAYNSRAARRSWRSMKSFFAEILR